VATEPTGNLRIELLGPVRAWCADEELDLGSARSKAVFALLAIRAGQTVSRREIITGVWGAEAPETDDSLETCLTGLRRVLNSARTGQSGDVLVPVEGGYSLRVDQDAVDVNAFARLREQSTIHAERGDFQAVVRSLTTALELWRDDALSDVSSPFAEVHRARLGEWRLSVRERRAEAMLALGQHLDVVAELAELASAHPLRERLRALLMLAQYRAGMPADALNGYQSAQLMAEKLGMQLGRVLRRLHEQILANDPALDMVTPPKGPPLVQSPQPAMPAPAASAPFVGRQQELGVFDTRLRALAAGRGGAVWIEGKPGIGKSRLLTVGLSSSVTPEVRLLRGAVDELSARFRLRVMTDTLQMAPAAVCSWRDPDPVLASIEKLSAAVSRLCADGPVAIAMDDLHQIDCASLMLWHRLVQITARQPLLLISTCRPLPRRAEIEWVRDGVTAAGGDLLWLDAESPLYLKEVVDAGSNAHSHRQPGRLRTRATTGV
jgi:DNA-binding SARP family transcriptional activator